MVAQMIIRGKLEAVMAMKTIDRARRSTEDGKTVVIPSLERPKQRIVFSSSPNSASCERVFALLRNPLRRAADELAGRLRAGGADAQLQPTQRGVNLGVVGAGGAHVCAKRNFQFSIKILFKIRGRRREIWGSK